MGQAWEELIGVLHEIAGLYLEMKVLAEKKRDALINVRVDVVNSTIVKEEALIKKINTLETKRQELVEQIAKDGNWMDEKIKLLDLVERAPEEFSLPIKEVSQNLADIIMKIAMLNNINNNLLKQAMHIIEYNINILSRAQATPFYDAGGGQNHEGKTGNNMGLSVFDRKA